MRLRRIIPILVTVLMVFAMAGTVYAIDADEAPPEIDISSLQVTLPEGKTEVTVGDSVKVSVKISDDNDISYVYINYVYHGSKNSQLFYPSYNSETEAYEATIPITEDTASGVSKISSIEARDSKGNYVSLSNSEVVETLYPDIPAAFFQPQADLSAGDFTVYGTSADVTSPEIDVSSLQVMLPEGKAEVTVGDSVKVSVKISDDNDISYVYINYVYHGSKNTQLFYPSYNSETEAYEATIPITEDTASGVSKISSIEAGDSKGNYVVLSNSEVVETLYPDIPAAFLQPQADLSAGDFTVSKRCMITFDTREGSTIDPQIVISGQTAARPKDPEKEGRQLRGWYTDEGLTDLYWFPKPVTEDITLYAGWDIPAGIGIYNESDPDNHQCGTIDITSAIPEFCHSDVKIMNYSLAEEADVTFEAKPVTGYRFKGWYEGVFGDSSFIETPSDTLISDQNPYTPENADEAKALCAVFEKVPIDYDLSNYTGTFDNSYRVLEDIASTPYEDWFYVVPAGTILEPIMKDAYGAVLSNEHYKASYSECTFYAERNEWDKIDDNAWIDHFPTEPGVYFCKVEGVDPYHNTFEWFDLIRIYDNITPDPTPDPSGGDDPTPVPTPAPDNMGKDGTAVGPGASAAVAEKAIMSATSDEGPKGTKYAPLKLKSIKQTNTSVKLTWTKSSKAKKYVVYGNLCGKSYKMKKLGSTTNAAKTITKIAGKKLKKGKYYKFIIVALDKNNKVVSTSKVIHVATKGGKVGNHKSVTVKKTVITNAKKLKKGKSLNLNAKAVKASKLAVKKHRAVSYESSNPKIATVSKSGVVKGKAKGTCYIYAYAQNGVAKKIKVVIK